MERLGTIYRLHLIMAPFIQTLHNETMSVDSPNSNSPAFVPQSEGPVAPAAVNGLQALSGLERSIQHLEAAQTQSQRAMAESRGLFASIKGWAVELERSATVRTQQLSEKLRETLARHDRMEVEFRRVSARATELANQAESYRKALDQVRAQSLQNARKHEELATHLKQKDKHAAELSQILADTRANIELIRSEKEAQSGDAERRIQVLGRELAAEREARLATMARLEELRLELAKDYQNQLTTRAAEYGHQSSQFRSAIQIRDNKIQELHAAVNTAEMQLKDALMQLQIRGTERSGVATDLEHRLQIAQQELGQERELKHAALTQIGQLENALRQVEKQQEIFADEHARFKDLREHCLRLEGTIEHQKAELERLRYLNGSLRSAMKSEGVRGRSEVAASPAASPAMPEAVRRASENFVANRLSVERELAEQLRHRGQMGDLGTPGKSGESGEAGRDDLLARPDSLSDETLI